MTEPGGRPRDATNIEATIVRDGDHYVINGRKWWTSGGGDPRCKISIFMGKTDPTNESRHRQQSMVLVPMDTPGSDHPPRAGVRLRRRAARALEIEFRRAGAGRRTCCSARAAASRSRRAGSGRAHPPLHAADRRDQARDREDVQPGGRPRTAFGRRLAEQGVWRERIADARMKVDQARASWCCTRPEDGRGGQQGGAEGDRDDQVVAPTIACEIIDQAIQLFRRGQRLGRLRLSAGCTPTRARSGSRTARTRCTATTSRRSKSRPT